MFEVCALPSEIRGRERSVAVSELFARPRSRPRSRPRIFGKRIEDEDDDENDGQGLKAAPLGRTAAVPAAAR
jgi:hypothetical protein